VDRSGEEPDLMEIDTVVRIGDVPVREVMEEGRGTKPVPEEAVRVAGAVPVQGTGEVIFTLKISLEMSLIRWVILHLRTPPKHHLLLSQNTLQKHPRVMSRERRGLKP